MAEEESPVFTTSTGPVRVITAASLFDGHDAAINVIRRLIQSSGAEVIPFIKTYVNLPTAIVSLLCFLTLSTSKIVLTNWINFLFLGLHWPLRKNV